MPTARLEPINTRSILHTLRRIVVVGSRYGGISATIIQIGCIHLRDTYVSGFNARNGCTARNDVDIVVTTLSATRLGL